MSTENTHTSANILAPGLVAALLLFLASWAVALRELPQDLARAEMIGYASMLIILAGSEWLALRGLLRTSALPLGFLQRVLHACLLAVVAAGGLGFAMWIYYAAVDPAYLQRFLDAYEQTLLAANVPASELAQRKDFLEANRDFLLSPFKQAMLHAGTALAIGLLTSPLAALLSGMPSRRKD